VRGSKGAEGYGRVSHARQLRPLDWETEQLTPSALHYDGKVAILVDETTQSSAEFHAMAFRTVPGAVVIGSTTAGADGDVSTVPIPSGLSIHFIHGMTPGRKPGH